MIFYNYYFLYLLLLLPILVFFIETSIKTFNLKKQVLIKSEALKKLGIENNLNTSRTKKYIYLVGIVFLILALARPQGSEVEKEIEERNAQFVIALDISDSMKANDVKNEENNTKISRFEASKTFIRNLINQLHGEKVSIVIFSEKAFTSLPLTNDYELITSYIDNLSYEYLPSGGTNIADAIKVAEKRFKNENKEQKNLLFILSDGEELTNESEKIFTSLNEKKIIIDTIGFGSKEGSKIIIGKDLSGGDIYKKYGNELVITKLNDELLKFLAKKTSGIYSEFNNKIPSEILNQIKKLDLSYNKKLKSIEYQEFFQIYIIIAFILFLFEKYKFKNFTNIEQLKNQKK